MWIGIILYFKNIFFYIGYSVFGYFFFIGWSSVFRVSNGFYVSVNSIGKKMVFGIVYMFVIKFLLFWYLIF